MADEILLLTPKKILKMVAKIEELMDEQYRKIMLLDHIFIEQEKFDKIVKKIKYLTEIRTYHIAHHNYILDH